MSNNTTHGALNATAMYDGYRNEIQRCDRCPTLVIWPHSLCRCCQDIEAAEDRREAFGDEWTTA